MTITQRIAALAGGVSQRPQAERQSNHAEAQLNALNSPSRGLSKRPPTVHQAALPIDIAGLDNGSVSPITMSATEQFLLLISYGAIAVFDTLSGIPVTVVQQPEDLYLTTDLEATEVSADTFTDADATALSAHNEGVAWTSLSGTEEATIISDQVRLSAVANNSYRYEMIPASTDYEVSVDATFPTVTTEVPEAGVLARRSAINQTGYRVRIQQTATWYQLLLDSISSGGAFVNLTSVVVNDNLAGLTKTIGIRVVGSTLQALVDGEVKLTKTSLQFAGPGSPGLYGVSGSAGLRVFLDNFRVETLAGGGGRSPFKVVQAGKQTVIANESIVVERDAETAPDKVFQALIVVRQADYGTQYALTLDNHQVSMGSIEGATPESRAEIDTTVIARKLKALLDESLTTQAAITVTQLGSTLLVTTTDGSDFTLTADDGLADNGLLVIKNSVQSFGDLPNKAPDGFTVEVTGNPISEADNYFVRFQVTDENTFIGTWKECVKPGEPVSLKASTLPHVLTYKGSLITPSEAQGTPPSPKIVPGGSGVLQTENWDPHSANLFAVALLTDHNDLVDATIGTANGIETEYSAYYNVNTMLATPENPAQIVLYKEVSVGSGTYTEIARQTFGPDRIINGQRIAAVATLAANQKLRLKLEYADGVTPPAKARFYTAPAASNPDVKPAIQFYKYTGKLVTFKPLHKYPQGARIRITCDGVNFDYTPSADATGTAVAIQLKTQIDAHATFVATNPDAGQILVTRADAASPVVTSEITWSELTTYHDPHLSLTTNALDPFIVKNLTDGSSGIIISNTPTTITVVGLTGGSDNRFQAEDKIEVIRTDIPYFTYGPAHWGERTAGTLVSNPVPSIVDQTINDVFITKGRLGLVSGGNIVLSEAGDLFNLFRTSVVQLLDADPIDIKPAHGEAVRFHSYSAWNGKDILWSDRQQFELSGEPLLTPSTVKLLPISEYPMDTIRPVVLGRAAYFISKRAGFAQVYSYAVMSQQTTPEARWLTQEVPSYIAGTALLMAGDEDAGMFVVLTDADRSKLYVHTYDRELEQQAWTEWQFSADTIIVGLRFLNGVLSIVSSRPDRSYLDTIDVASLDTIDLLDRRKAFAAGTGVFAAGSTTWTLPYPVATDGSAGAVVVVNATTGAVIASTRPTATTVSAVGDFSAVAVSVGLTYTFSHTLSTIFKRRSNGSGQEFAVETGRLQLSRAKVFYDDPSNFTVSVTPLGRATRTYTADSDGADGELSLPVGCRNSYATIVISNALPVPTRISGLEWEGTNYTRSQRA